MLSAVTYSSCDEESNWKRRKCKNRLKQIQKEEEVDRGKQGWDGENKNDPAATVWECWVFPLGFMSPLSLFYLPLLSSFSLPHTTLSSPFLFPDAGQTKHFGETQLFYRWDQRQIVCACAFLPFCARYIVHLWGQFSQVSNRRFILNLGLKFLLKK